MTFKYLDKVQLAETTEVNNCFFLNKGTEGLVIDQTVPNYYLVKFDKVGCYWIDGKHLVKENN